MGASSSTLVALTRWQCAASSTICAELGLLGA